MTEMTETALFNKMAARCSAAECCRAEIIEKLQRQGVAYEIVNRVVDRLVKEKYIDEERYCRAFIRDKYRFARWGKKKIIQELQLKKIPQSLYFSCMDVIDKEEYLSILQHLLSTKKKSLRGDDEYERNAKLIRFALGRGFAMDDIRSCMDISD